MTQNYLLFSWYRFRCVLVCFNFLSRHWFIHYGRRRLYSIPKIVISGGPPRTFDLTSEVISWPETLKLSIIGFLSQRAKRSFFSQTSSSVRSQTRKVVSSTLCRRRTRNGISSCHHSPPSKFTITLYIVVKITLTMKSGSGVPFPRCWINLQSSDTQAQKRHSKSPPIGITEY